MLGSVGHQGGSGRDHLWAQDLQPKAVNYIQQTIILSYCLAAEEMIHKLSGFFFWHLPPRAMLEGTSTEQRELSGLGQCGEGEVALRAPAPSPPAILRAAIPCGGRRRVPTFPGNKAQMAGLSCWKNLS